MHNQIQRGSDNKDSVFQRCAALIGTCLGVCVAILTTPPLFMRIRGPLFLYLHETWGSGLAAILTWTMGGAIAVILYALVKLLFTSLAVWGIAALAARRFPGT